MGIDSRCKLMVGLPYEEIVDHVEDQEELDDNIRDGVLEYGSCYYDSSFDENIIGFVVTSTSSYCKIDTIGTLHAKVIEATKEFNKIFPELTPQIYMTLDIT
jgi:hypothetical protein